MINYWFGVISGVFAIVTIAWWTHNIERRIRELEDAPMFGEVEFEESEHEIETSFCLQCGKHRDWCECPGDSACVIH